MILATLKNDSKKYYYHSKNDACDSYISPNSKNNAVQCPLALL